jgi:signal transduction histidine kinase
MTDPELQAAMQVLSVILPASLVTDSHLFCLLACRMVNVSVQHGISGASADGYANLGFFLGPTFHRYGEGYLFAKLACDLVQKHGFIAYQAKVYLVTGAVGLWTEPIEIAINFMRIAFRTAVETGDPTFACYSLFQSVILLVLRNDPLEAVWRESEKCLDIIRKAKYDDMADAIVSQQRFIANMQGRTATLSSFSNAEFDEATFEARLTGERLAVMTCHYWIVKLKARFLSGDYAEALAAVGKLKPLLWSAAGQIQLLDYFYYAALTLAACYENAPADEQNNWREILTAHREKLREWAENYPPTFANRHALVSAEIARLEGRGIDAMQLYEQAIQSAREHGFVQNEALAHEVAARFYAARGVESVARACLRDARRCYLRWGGFGKVQQLERLYPWLAEESAVSVPSATIDAPVEQLDVGTVIKASQAVSSEIELAKLIATLMRISLEHAGAERGLLILFTGNEPRIVAEARTGGSDIEVTLRNEAVTPSELLESVLHTAMRTRESAIVDDASARIPFSADEYVRQKHARSVLCLPLVKQAKLVGALYLENNLAPHVFTPAKLAVLKLLASQAAISLENVRLYEDLRRSEAYLSEAQRLSHTGSFGWRPADGETYWSEETFRIFEFDGASASSTDLLIQQRIHPEDVATWRQVIERAAQEGQDYALEYRLRMPDGRVKHLQVAAHATRNETKGVHFVGAVMDVTTIRLAEMELHKTRTELAHAARMTSLGALTASIAHEVNQPLMAIETNAESCLLWLAREQPNLDKARAAAERIVKNSRRGGDVVRSIRALARQSVSEMVMLDISRVIGDTLELLQSELHQHDISLETRFSRALGFINGDRTQLQQVIVNLVMNAIEAMSTTTGSPRILRVITEADPNGDLLTSVEDSGSGIAAGTLERIFDPMFTTKSDGMGLGLSICRSIVEAHGGRLWAIHNPTGGSIFRFSIPRATNG